MTACRQDAPRFRIGVAQCSDDSWRHKMNDEILREAMFYDGVSVEIRSAADDNRKQAEDVHSNRSYGNYTLVESPDGNMKYPASIWRFPKPHPSVALHATEKPVDLLRYAIRTYTDRNAIVLDNCCGTGSTLIAAKLEGRRYIGIDNGVCDKKKSPYYGMPWAQVAQIRLEVIDHEPADEPERHRPLGEGTTEGVCTPSGVSA